MWSRPEYLAIMVCLQTKYLRQQRASSLHRLRNKGRVAANNERVAFRWDLLSSLAWNNLPKGIDWLLIYHKWSFTLLLRWLINERGIRVWLRSIEAHRQSCIQSRRRPCHMRSEDIMKRLTTNTHHISRGQLFSRNYTAAFLCRWTN